jgi:hypothetical protein
VLKLRIKIHTWPQRTNVLPHVYISSTITAKKKNTIPSYFKGSSA